MFRFLKSLFIRAAEPMEEDCDDIGTFEEAWAEDGIAGRFTLEERRMIERKLGQPYRRVMASAEAARQEAPKPRWYH